MPEKGVRVMVRVRPMLPRELSFDAAVEVTSPDNVLVYKSNAEFKSRYSHVFDEHAQQEDVYQLVRAGVLSAMQGFNSTCMAYGQTGSGKTFTMMGPHELDLLSARAPERMPAETWASVGVVPRALADLFKEVGAVRQRGSARIKVVASYIEIHNDRMYDLLQPYKKGMGNRDPYDVMQRKAALEVREGKDGAMHVPSLCSVEVPSYSAVLQLLAKGNSNRAVRHTEMNVHSSRSHAILQLLVEQWPGQGEGPAIGTTSSHGVSGEAAAPAGGGVPGAMVMRSKVNFIDLAGSERWNKDSDMGSERISELTAINSSLSALAGVVSALTGGVARKHVPYRDSKLTSLLQDSLGGNCNTTIIATISPCVNAFEETVSTLKFADRARAIANNPVVNTARDVSSMLALKEKEIQRLRMLLATYMQQQEQQQLQGALSLQSQQLPDLKVADPARTEDIVSGRDASLLPPEAAELLAQLEAAKSELEAERRWRQEMEARMQPQGSAQSLPLAPSGASFTTLSSYQGHSTGLPPSSGSLNLSSHIHTHGPGLAWPTSADATEHAGQRPAEQQQQQQQQQQQAPSQHSPSPSPSPSQQQQQQQQQSHYDYLRVSTHSKNGSTAGTDSEASPQSAAASPSGPAAGAFFIHPHGSQPSASGSAAAPSGRQAWATPPLGHDASPPQHAHTMRSHVSNGTGDLRASHDAADARAEGALGRTPGSKDANSGRGRTRGGGWSRPGSARSQQGAGSPNSSTQHSKQQQQQQQQHSGHPSGAGNGQGGAPAARRGAKTGAAAEPAAPRSRAERQAQRSKQLYDAYGSPFSRLAAASNYSGSSGNGQLSRSALSSSGGRSQANGDQPSDDAAGRAHSTRAAKPDGASALQPRPKPSIYGSSRVRPRPIPKILASLHDAAFHQAVAAAHASVQHNKHAPLLLHKQRGPGAPAPKPCPSPRMHAPAAAPQHGDAGVRMPTLHMARSSSSGVALEASSASNDQLYNSSDEDFVQQQQRELQQLRAQHEQLLREQQQQEEEQLWHLQEMRRRYQEEAAALHDVQQRQQLQQASAAAAASAQGERVEGGGGGGAGARSQAMAMPTTPSSSSSSMSTTLPPAGPVRWGRSSLKNTGTSPPVLSSFQPQEPVHAPQGHLTHSGLGALVPSSPPCASTSSRGGLSRASSSSTHRLPLQHMPPLQHAEQAPGLLAPLSGGSTGGGKRWGRSALLAI